MNRKETRTVQGHIGAKRDGVWGPESQRYLESWCGAQYRCCTQEDALEAALCRDRDLTRMIDVSYHQGDIDWDEAIKDVSWAVIKVTEGKDYQDPKGHQNMREANDAGLGVEAYHLARLIWDGEVNDPVACAQNAVRHVPPREFIWLDLETKWVRQSVDVAGLKATWDWILTWIEEVERYYPTGIYLSHRGARILGRPRITRPTWWADYGGSHHSWEEEDSRLGPRRRLGWNDWTVRQFSSSGSVRGIEGRVDLNWRVG